MKIVQDRKDQFAEIVTMIQHTRSEVVRLVNASLIDLYWRVGRYISDKISVSEWGDGVVKQLADYIERNSPEVKGFSDKNLWRMKQFYETYKDADEKLSPLVREISWSNNLLILTGCKTDEAKEFYMRLCIRYGYSKRELERQIDSMLYERTMLFDAKNKQLIAQNEGLSALRDAYVFEFLELPPEHKEKDLRKAIVGNLKDFILEFGKDFTFVGEEYRVQVGNTDFFIDLLFYNRALSCLVAVELKVGKFKPEHIGQINFYLEALDRDVKKPTENPSVGLILCASKDDAVVEYALSRSMSPTMVSDYTLQLPDKKLLQEKLRELTDIALIDTEE